MTALRPLYRLSARPPRQATLSPIPTTPAGHVIPDDLPEDIQRLVPLMGEQNARICWQLLQRGVYGSSPELLAYDWLERRKIPFEFQASVYGGSAVDFALYHMPACLMVWRIQGEHYHGSAESLARDEAAKFRLLRAKKNGLPIRYVVDIWENDIYRSKNAVCEDALQGKAWRD